MGPSSAGAVRGWANLPAGRVGGCLESGADTALGAGGPASLLMEVSGTAVVARHKAQITRRFASLSLSLSPPIALQAPGILVRSKELTFLPAAGHAAVSSVPWHVPSLPCATWAAEHSPFLLLS